MIHLTQTVNSVLKRREIKFFGWDRIRSLERKINSQREESVLEEVMNALRSEFGDRLDRKDYEEIEKMTRKEMKKIYL